MRKVLVVDDDEIVARILVKLLQREGYDVIFALGGESALKIVVDFKPDVVFVDLSMPGMNGYELAQQLRALGPDGTPKLVSHTSHRLGTGGGDDTIFDDYLLKPANVEGIRKVTEG